MRTTLLVIAVAGFATLVSAQQQSAPRRPGAPVTRVGPVAPAPLDVTVSEGTSMSVAISPDGRTLATDLQGSIWVVPASGGAMKRITDVFNDARQPVWSPDGRTIAFFGYRDGGYDIWAIDADGANQRKLTWGPFDDREPAFSHDGSRLAFSSDRGNPMGSDYNIWTLDLRSGELRQITKSPSEEMMPTWSADDGEIAYASSRDAYDSIWAMNVRSLGERRVRTVKGARLDAPSWGRGGELVYHVTAQGRTRLEIAGQSVTGDENVFPFRASWASATEYLYVSDGRIRRRSIAGLPMQTVDFTATLAVTHPEYQRRVRDFTSTTPRKVLGIVRPVISPDGTQIAFAAVGDIYVMPVSGGAPVNITRDEALDTDPAWSPDGGSLVYSSDKDSPHLQLWIRDLKSGVANKVTDIPTQPQGASFSPDGKRIVFFNVDGEWRVAEMSVLDVASGRITKIHDSLPQPGIPTWSPDGKRIALAGIAPMTVRFREGTNQIQTISASGGDVKWYAPMPMLSIDSRGGAGPVWSPDGSKMAAIYEGVLAVWPVSVAGEPLGPPRRVTSESAHAPSWQGDSRHILYQSLDQLRIVDVESGETRTVPFNMTWTPAIPKGRVVVHAGKLLDMKSPVMRSNVDVIVIGNTITSVVPHAAAHHLKSTVVDASDLTVMPGLTEFHSHLQKDYGAAQLRAWLAFGITTVRSPGNTPYEAVEDREANEAGVRPGPRVYGTGYLMEWNRVYYKMGIAISNVSHLEMELERARVLQHDLIKSYVRLPDLQQRRLVEFAHGIGVPVTSHEIFPAAMVGVDNTEHTGATSRRGYSPKIATQQTAYEDVIQLFGKSRRVFAPTMSGGGARELFQKDPALITDARFTLYPGWIQRRVAQQQHPFAVDPRGGSGRMVVNVMKAGALVVAGTDTPNAINLHGELMAYTMAGMSTFDALKTATVNPAIALGLNAGTIEPGKLADLIAVDGDPIASIASTYKVKKVVANGRPYDVGELVTHRQ
ncbi:MAG TPA: amidohydrolase family protein [Vicinamibacterales bacterium]|nr:amidohydrolase family protein [Vicinamibacterales bacterium]